MKLALALVLVAAQARADPLTLGARVGPQWMFLEGDGPPADLTGWTFGVDVAYPLSRRLALGAAADVATYPERSDRLPPGSGAHGLATYLELHADTDPSATWSATVDLGTGFRWLSIPLDAGPTDHVRAWEPVRVRAGPTWRGHGSTRVALVVGAGVGFVVSRAREGACSVTGTCADSLYDSDTQSSAEVVLDLTLVVRGWP
jgi:hypothetical protein